MDTNEFLAYHEWADSMILESIKQVSGTDFKDKPEKVRSIRGLLEHYLISYEYLILPSDKIEDRIAEISEMSRKQLVSEIPKASKKFREVVLEFKQEMTMKIRRKKTIILHKDNYLLLYLDHLTYHRGQLTHSLKMKGYRGVNTDYYDFLEKVKYSP